MGIEDETCTVYGIGEQSPFKLSDAISNMISDACTPQIEPDISIRTIENKNQDKWNQQTCGWQKIARFWTSLYGWKKSISYTCI